MGECSSEDYYHCLRTSSRILPDLKDLDRLNLGISRRYNVYTALHIDIKEQINRSKYSRLARLLSLYASRFYVRSRMRSSKLIYFDSID